MRFLVISTACLWLNVEFENEQNRECSTIFFVDIFELPKDYSPLALMLQLSANLKR